MLSETAKRRPTKSAAERAPLATAAYEQIRRAILSGELRPNEPLVEATLAEWLNVSRTPLREALARLSSDGLVTRGTRSWIVREHTPQEVSEIHEVRAGLEGMAAYLAAQRGSDEQIAEIAAFHERENSSDRERLVTAPRLSLVEYNDAFHEAVVAAAGNLRLRDFLRQNREFFFTYRIAKLYSEDEARISLKGHDAVVEGLAKRDPERAQAAMRNHILEARDLIISKLY